MRHHSENAPERDTDVSTDSGSDRSPERRDDVSSDPSPPESLEAPFSETHTETAPTGPEEHWGRSRVTNVFYGMVNAQNGVFGVNDAEDPARGGSRSSVTGPLRDHEVQAVADVFAAPDRFDEACERLREQRVLVLTGGAGTGKRTGAVRLLSKTGCDKITVLSPSQTLGSLTEHDLRSGRGYIVLDWFGVDHRSSPAEHRYLWSLLLRHVQDSGAHLVLTCDQSAFFGPAAPVFTWTRPHADEVIRRHLHREWSRAGEVSDEATGAVEIVVKQLPDEVPVADLVAVARAMADGESPLEAVDRILRSSSRDRVEEWFGSAPDPREIAEAAALGLLPGARERDYEILADRLHTRLEKAFSFRMDDSGEDGTPSGDRIPMRRKRRSNEEHRLFRVEYRDDGWMVRRFPCFTEEGDGPEVLRQLWERYDVTFWDTVRGWIGSAIGHSTRRVHLARGLASLAVVAFDEVHDLYLDRWSRQPGVPGRETCVFALWFMCMETEHGLAPRVLRAVDRWLFHGTPLQKRTAIQVWSGELGVSYPTEAAKRLLELVLDPKGGQRTEAAFAVGALFGSLLDRRGSGRPLVRFVNDELSRTQRFSPRREERDLLMFAAFSLLTVPTSEPPTPGSAGPEDVSEDGAGEGPAYPRTEGGAAHEAEPDGSSESGGTGVHNDDEKPDSEPAIARHIMLAPDQIPEVAALWAATIHDRQMRRPAIDSLLDTLRALQRNGIDAQEKVRDLLTGLSRLIPEEEYPRFLISVDSAARRREDTDSFTDAVLGVLSGIFGDNGDVPGMRGTHDSPLTKKVTSA